MPLSHNQTHANILMSRASKRGLPAAYYILCIDCANQAETCLDMAIQVEDISKHL